MIHKRKPLWPGLKLKLLLCRQKEKKRFADYDEGLETSRTMLLRKVKEIKEQRASNHPEEATANEARLRRVFRSLAGPTSN